MEATALEFLKIQFDFNSEVISKNIAGITDEESRIFHQDGANPFNWIFGHLILIRNSMIEILGGKPIWDDEDFSIYQRGEKPENHKNNFTDFDTLKSYFKDSETELNRIFKGSVDINPKNISDLSALMLHEIYHAGQLGYVRRLLGKEGAIK